MDHLNRREMLRMAVALAGAGAIGKQIDAAQESPANTLRFFPGFKSSRVKTSGAEINVVSGGSSTCSRSGASAG